ncbi:hypothetical protein CC80DRAFT_553467 [Byssothecium circinans]|uniref:F-box domain-containing protein n=1 Tax=Byssothecium circinans TaxID=147558 RepID=A0A6A5TFJ1_9PLEO|nr:hypothetical protein CC80DRAFT_553467 [Byssothecium circinans]
MATLSTLPNELLLNIAHGLVGTDICNLARTCRDLQSIAETELYEHIIVPSPLERDRSYKPDFINHTVLLACTLAGRPDLAAKTRSISLFSGWSEYPYEQTGCETELEEVIHTLQFEDMIFDFCFDKSPDRKSLGSYITRIVRWRDWIAQLRQSDTKPWVGIILLLLPNLEALGLTFFSKQASFGEDLLCDGCTYDICHLSELFGGGLSFNPALVPGLQKVQSLNLVGKEISMCWLELPSLKHLIVGPQATFEFAPGAPDRLQTMLPSNDLTLTDITATCWTYPFLSGSAEWQDGITGSLPLGLGWFRHVRSLTLNFRNSHEGHDVNEVAYSKRILQQSAVGDCSVLVQKLSPLAATLESLHLLFPEYVFGRKRDLGSQTIVPRHSNVDCLKYINPLSTLSNFKQLKHLTIPQALLIPRTHHSRSPQSKSNAPINEVLPPSLESLCIHFPEMNIREWLVELLRDRSSFPKLNKVVLQTSTGAGADYGILAWEDHAVWDELKQAGIQVTVEDMGEAKPEWDEGTGSKDVANIAGRLQTIDEPEERDVVGLEQFWSGIEEGA